MSTRKSFLELQIIYKDDDLIELRVSASNIRFSGTTEVYDGSHCLKAFAEELVGFPHGSNQLFYEAGDRDGYAYFSIKFYTVGVNGKVGVEIQLESNTLGYSRPEEKNLVKLEILVEPAAIDCFQRELLHVAEFEFGSAVLLGADSIRE